MPEAISIADIRGRARWYVNIRWFYLLAIGVPGITSLYITNGFTPQVREDILFVAGMLAINGIFMATTYTKPSYPFLHRVIAVLQITFDLMVMSAAFYLNRGSETPLMMLYAIPIVMSAAFLSRRGVYMTGVAATLIFISLSFLDFTRVLPVLHIAAPNLHTDPNLFYPPLVTVVATMLAITFITDLVGRLIRQREQLVQEMQALTARNAQTEAILRTLGSALIAVNRTGHITLVNNTFEELTGWKRKEVVGRPLDEVLPILDMHGKRVQAAHRPMLAFITDNASPKELHFRSVAGYSYLRKNGTTFPFVGNVAPVISRGKVVGFTTVFDDATESKKIEQLRDNFIALISHQLKTPINEINGYAYNLLGGVAGHMNEKQTEYVTAVQELAARAGKLIADLLDIVLAGQGNLAVHNELTELGPIVAQVAKLREQQAKRKGISIEAKVPDGLIYIRGDEHKLTQALGNLVDNAIRYTKTGTVTLSVVPADEVVEVYVSDSGTGMDPTTLEALFGSDEQKGPLSRAPTAEGGTGLGVYLAKQLISLMNGSVRVVSSSKRGTTIGVTFNRVHP